MFPRSRSAIVGSGQLDDALAGPPANVRWEPWVDTTSFPISTAPQVARSGSSARPTRPPRHPEQGVPGARDATPLITADTPAARELLEDGRDASGASGNPEALARRRFVGSRRTRRSCSSIGDGGDDLRGERVRRSARPQVASAARAAETLSRRRTEVRRAHGQITEAAALDSDEESVYLERRTENGQSRALRGGLLSASSDALLS